MKSYRGSLIDFAPIVVIYSRVGRAHCVCGTRAGDRRGTDRSQPWRRHMKNTQESVTSPVTELAFTAGASRLSPPDAAARALLRRWVRAPTTPQRVAQRSRIVLLALDGVGDDEIASRLQVSRPTVRLWTRRFDRSGPEALLRDAPGRGRPAAMAPATMSDRLRQANLLGPDGLPVSLRQAAKFLGISASSVWRALRRAASGRRHNPPSAG
jgi:hypothetical protein